MLSAEISETSYPFEIHPPKFWDRVRLQPKGSAVWMYWRMLVEVSDLGVVVVLFS